LVHQASTAPPDNNDTVEASIKLARGAANDELPARKKVNSLAHPIISYQTDRFCKRFCAENQYRYRCSLQTPWGSAPSDALLCEWGNASYGWMLDDLTNSKRLTRYEGKNGALLQNYLFHIANSRPFYERWKDWRFGRRINVPDYIKDIDPLAPKLFLALRSGDNATLIAQKLSISEHHADTLCQKVIVALTQRKRLHLLNPDRTQSLATSQSDNEGYPDQPDEMDIAVDDIDITQTERTQILGKAWASLNAVEQFVLEAMIIEEQDANDVLAALKKLDIPLNSKIPAHKTDRQQLYYFRRKTLAKLAEFTGLK